MEIGETLYVTGRGEWRRWLEANFETAPEIWLVYPNKASGEPRIPYNDAVEEALCFGWIDSIIKKPDELRAAQRFSPRRRGSRYSQLNKERLRWLVAEGLLHPSVRESVEEVLREEFVFPEDDPRRDPGERAGMGALRGLLRRLPPHPRGVHRCRQETPRGVREPPPQLPQGHRAGQATGLRRRREVFLKGAPRLPATRAHEQPRTVGPRLPRAGRRPGRAGAATRGRRRAASRGRPWGGSPTIWPTGSPPLKTSSVGIERIPYLPGGHRVLVGVELHELHPAVVLVGELLDDRRDHAAGAAPGRPEVDQHRVVVLDHVRVERRVRRVGRHRHDVHSPFKHPHPPGLHPLSHGGPARARITREPRLLPARRPPPPSRLAARRGRRAPRRRRRCAARSRSRRRRSCRAR